MSMGRVSVSFWLDSWIAMP